jgi:glycosyltransferase involved in cell wall biosynthesis
MNILLVEPFLTGSHKAWAEEYARYSSHEVDILGLEGRYWKWRMHGGAVTLADYYLENELDPDLILATDMLDLTTFLALTRERTAGKPVAVYFHENQLSYPWSDDDPDPGLERDVHYGFINYTTALAADAVLFNSAFHLKSFLFELPRMLEGFPDYNEPATVAEILAKSSVLPLGVDLAALNKHKVEKGPGSPPLILWNHRWEYDKNPGDFFEALFELAGEDLDFEIAVLGEKFSSSPPIFEEAEKRLGDRVVQFGYMEDFAEYARWLWKADILPVTSNHDFFGASTVQAIYCGCVPLLPGRLAFPEHLPEESRNSFIYRDQRDLVDRLRDLISGRSAPPAADLREYVRRYDWSNLTKVYDDIFNGLAESR